MALTARLKANAAWADSFSLPRPPVPLGIYTAPLPGHGHGAGRPALVVLEMTESPFMVGVSAAVRMAPYFFLGILSGAVADRVDRRLP